jgi:hypothetical protein
MRLASMRSFALPVLPMLVAGCEWMFGPAPFPEQLPVVTDTTVVAVSGVAPDPITPGAHGFSPDFLSVCQSLGWSANCSDPVYTDDQRLRLNSMYGSHGYIAPSPGLAGWDFAAYSTPRLVGMVWFKAEAGGIGATDWLPPGLTCVYLQSSGSGFAGFAQSGQTCPTTPGAGAMPLVVQAITNPGQFGTGTEAQQAAHVPPVARFHEGAKKAGSSDVTMLGFKCASRWCVLAPAQQSAALRQVAHAGLNQGWRTWAISGWSDAQRLAVGSAGNLNVSGLNSSIIADTGLAGKAWAPVANPTTFVPGPAQHVATIVMRERPSGNYAEKWHLQRGYNELYFWRDAAGKWYGEIQNQVGSMLYRIPIYVDKKHAGTNPPATARFRWNADDEEVWVACEGGCCYVSAFQ